MLTETNAVKKDEKQYNPLAFLNLVRLILALSIVLWHFPYGYSEYNGLFPDSFFAGWRDIVRYGGNQAFLVISGMLFYHSYYQRLDQKGPGGVSIQNFLWKRIERIYPTAILTCLVCYLIAVVAHLTYAPDTSIGLIELVQDCLFLGTRAFSGMFGNYNGPVWFLSALMFSYLLSCLIILLTRKKRSVYWFLIPMIVCFVIALGADNIIPITKYSNELFNFYLGFFFMIFLEKFITFKKSFRICLRIFCLVVAFIYVYVFYKDKGNTPFGSGEIVGSLFCFLPLFTVLYGTRINHWFDNKVFKTISGVTFYIYLWHTPVFRFIEMVNRLSNKTIIGYEGLKNLLLFFLILIAISFLNYYLEKYIIKWISSKKKEKQKEEEIKKKTALPSSSE